MQSSPTCSVALELSGVEGLSSGSLAPTSCIGLLSHSHLPLYLPPPYICIWIHLQNKVHYITFLVTVIVFDHVDLHTPSLDLNLVSYSNTCHHYQYSAPLFQTPENILFKYTNLFLELYLTTFVIVILSGYI